MKLYTLVSNFPSHTVKLIKALQYVGCMCLLVLISIADAADQPSPPISAYAKYKSYNVSFNVLSDGTATKDVSFRIELLNSAGIKYAKYFHFDEDSFIQNQITDYDLKVKNAYLLKRDGSRINGTEIQYPPSPEIKMNGRVVKSIPIGINKSYSFPEAEVGDEIVVDYQVNLNKSLPNKSVSISQILPGAQPHDNAVILLTAPSAMNLRVEANGFSTPQHTIAGLSEKWLWKYQSTKPDFSLPQLHITSFKDFDQEARALNEIMENQLDQPLATDSVCPSSSGKFATDGPAAVAQNGMNVAYYFWQNAKRLDQMVNAWVDKPCVMDDGRNIIVALSAGLETAATEAKNPNQFYDRVKEIRALNLSNNSIAALAEAVYWNQYAWSARGEGLASSVTKEGWKLFNERLEKEEKVLIESKPYASRIPTWYELMINVQFLLHRPELRQTYLEAVQKFPYYYQIYFNASTFLQPKWGGSWEQLDSLVMAAVKNTKPIDGDSVYARIYWVTYASSFVDGISFFKETKVNWGKMKKGFEDLMARHPKSNWNLNNFAKFACLANDKPTFLKLRKKIGSKTIDQVWGEGASLDYCETKYGYVDIP